MTSSIQPTGLCAHGDGMEYNWSYSRVLYYCAHCSMFL